MWGLLGALFGLGALAGLHVRAPAMLAGTALFAAAFGLARGFAWPRVVAEMALAIFTFQVAYLVGVALLTLWRRSRRGKGER